MEWLSTEHDEQVAIFEWAKMMEGRWPELALLHAIPNGAKTPYKKIRSRRSGKAIQYSPERLRLMKEGLKPGVPDICLPSPRGNYHGLYIELKHGKNKHTDEQKWWLEMLSKQGYRAIACWEAEGAIKAITGYLNEE